jgi:hypothetical protein
MKKKIIDFLNWITFKKPIFSNELEAIKDLKSYYKPYEKINMLQGQFSNTIINYEVGMSKPKTIHRFLEKFGYFKEGDVFIKKFSVCKKKKPIKKPTKF